MSLSQLVSGFVRPTRLFHGVRSVVLLKETSWAGTKVLYVTLSKANISKFRPVPPKKKRGWGVVCQTNWMDPFDNNLVKIHMCAIMAGPP